MVSNVKHTPITMNTSIVHWIQRGKLGEGGAHSTEMPCHENQTTMTEQKKAVAHSGPMSPVNSSKPVAMNTAATESLSTISWMFLCLAKTSSKIALPTLRPCRLLGGG